MHVPWGWIKQRPHFIAENLAKDFEVDVYYKKANTVNENNLTKNSISQNLKLNIFSYRSIPFSRIPIVKHLNLSWINILLFRLKIRNIGEYDYIWLTSPSQKYLVNGLDCNKLVYDCMDDFMEFEDIVNNNFLKNKIKDDETYLLDKSKYVFCSSSYLANKIVARSGINRQITIINNAININEKNTTKFPSNVQIIFDKLNSISNIIMYVGTISDWINYDLLIKLLDINLTANVVLIGPNNNIKLPKHERLYFLGVIDNSYILHAMSYASVLIMPFIVNELIKSVNPVKLYEYIFTGKPVVAPYYGETVCFEKYVYLYNNDSDFIEIVTESLLNSRGKSDYDNMKTFATNNTWLDRYVLIKKTLEQ